MASYDLFCGLATLLLPYFVLISLVSITGYTELSTGACFAYSFWMLLSESCGCCPDVGVFVATVTANCMFDLPHAIVGIIGSDVVSVVSYWVAVDGVDSADAGGAWVG